MRIPLDQFKLENLSVDGGKSWIFGWTFFVVWQIPNLFSVDRHGIELQKKQLKVKWFVWKPRSSGDLVEV